MSAEWLVIQEPHALRLDESLQLAQPAASHNLYSLPDSLLIYSRGGNGQSSISPSRTHPLTDAQSYSAEQPPAKLLEGIKLYSEEQHILPLPDP